jgi:hypothetical protein
LGEKAEVAKGTVLRAEHGEDVRPSSGRRIARALGVEISDLVPEKPGSARELIGAGKAEAPQKGPQLEYEIVYPARAFTPENREKVMDEAVEVAREAKQDYDPNTMRIILVDDGETIEVRAEPISAPSLRTERSRRATRSS